MGGKTLLDAGVAGVYPMRLKTTVTSLDRATFKWLGG